MVNLKVYDMGNEDGVYNAYLLLRGRVEIEYSEIGSWVRTGCWGTPNCQEIRLGARRFVVPS